MSPITSVVLVVAAGVGALTPASLLRSSDHSGLEMEGATSWTDARREHFQGGRRMRCATSDETSPPARFPLPRSATDLCQVPA